MDQIMMGTFLAKKRKEKNMTQAALAERLGVTNKTISKWETGKCMPDYSVIELLCKAPLARVVPRGLGLSSTFWLSMKAQRDPYQEALLLLSPTCSQVTRRSWVC